MGKLNTYMIILPVVLLLFHFGGLIQGTGLGYLLGVVGITEPERLADSNWYAALYAIITTVTAAGIMIGIATKQDALSTAVALSAVTFIPIFFLIGWDLIVLYNTVALSNQYVAAIIFVPLIFVYFMSAYNWWRGTD
jgi:hypothetical protein